MCWVSDVNMTKWNKLIQMLSTESQFFYGGRAAKISFYTYESIVNSNQEKHWFTSLFLRLFLI